MNNQPLVFERLYNAPVEKVWRAITDRDEMKEWYFDLSEFKAEIGFEFEFSGGPEDGIQYLHKCVITEVVPLSKLTYSWRYEGYQGNTSVSFELFKHGDDTKLRLTHVGLETLPSTDDFARENFIGGWNEFINIRLKEYLDRTSNK